MGKERVFALIQLQMPLIKKLCFKACGKILIGVLVDKEIGEMFPCKTEDCPYEEGRLHLGECFDGDVWVRKLADPDNETPQGSEELAPAGDIQPLCASALIIEVSDGCVPN